MSIFISFIFCALAILLSFFFAKKALIRFKYARNLKDFKSIRHMLNKLSHRNGGSPNSESLRIESVKSILYVITYFTASLLVLIFTGWVLSQI
jgi:hypothetical protein